MMSDERINVTNMWEAVFIGFKDQLYDEEEGKVKDGNNPQMSVVVV